MCAIMPANDLEPRYLGKKKSLLPACPPAWHNVPCVVIVPLTPEIPPLSVSIHPEPESEPEPSSSKEFNRIPFHHHGDDDRRMERESMRILCCVGVGVGVVSLSGSSANLLLGVMPCGRFSYSYMSCVNIALGWLHRRRHPASGPLKQGIRGHHRRAARDTPCQAESRCTS